MGPTFVGRGRPEGRCGLRGWRGSWYLHISVKVTELRWGAAADVSPCSVGPLLLVNFLPFIQIIAEALDCARSSQIES